MQTTIDPDEARRFATWLDEETDALVNDLSKVSVSLIDLSIIWNDARYEDYLNKFDEHTVKLKTFTDISKGYVSYLRSAADRAEAYLNPYD